MDALKIEGSLHALAYDLAVEQLARTKPEALELPAVLDAIRRGVIDLAGAGQRDTEALARYAASRGEAVYNITRR